MLFDTLAWFKRVRRHRSYFSFSLRVFLWLAHLLLTFENLLNQTLIELETPDQHQYWCASGGDVRSLLGPFENFKRAMANVVLFRAARVC